MKQIKKEQKQVQKLICQKIQMQCNLRDLEKQIEDLQTNYFQESVGIVHFFYQGNVFIGKDNNYPKINIKGEPNVNQNFFSLSSVSSNINKYLEKNADKHLTCAIIRDRANLRPFKKKPSIKKKINSHK